jgi:hypothetical protein
MTSLGQRLANNIAVQIANTVPPAILAEQKRQEKIRVRNLRATRFFAKAQQFFTDGILAGTPMASLEMHIGNDPWNRDIDRNEEMAEAMLGYYDSNGHYYASMDGIGGVPQSMTDPDRLAPHWADFQAWAASNDLRAYWKSGQGGVAGYWLLRVEPATQAA